MVATAVETGLALGAQGLDVGVVNARWINHREEAIMEAAQVSDCLITLEENVLAGGSVQLFLVLESEYVGQGENQTVRYPRCLCRTWNASHSFWLGLM